MTRLGTHQPLYAMVDLRQLVRNLLKRRQEVATGSGNISVILGIHAAILEVIG